MTETNPKNYGASGSGRTTTGTISSGTSSLSVSSSLDFTNGQGIRVNHAGAAFAINQPSGLSVTPQGATGATNRAYTIASLNSNGGVGQSIANVTISNSNATLTSSNFNRLTWTAPTGAAPKAYAIYGNTSGAMSLIGIVAAGTTSFDDTGGGAITAPDWIPSAPQTSASLNDWLITTISSGAGTTTLTLATNASATATSQIVAHDDTASIQAAINQAQNDGSAVYLPSGTYPISSSLIVSNRIKIFGDGYQSDAEAVYNAHNIAQSSGFVASVIVPLPSVSGIVATTNHAVTLEGFQIMYPTGPTPFPNTVGITVKANSGPTDANVNTVLRDVLTLGAYRGVSFVNCLQFVVDNCNILQGWGSGISLEGENFPSYGDSIITNSSVWGNGVPTYAFHIGISAGGGLRVVNNKLNFAHGVNTSGILINPNLSVTQTVEPLVISNNSIEGAAVGINFSNANLANAAMSQVVISGNQIWSGLQCILVNTGGSTQWIGGMSITGNCFMVNGGAGKTCVIIDNTYIGTITGNTFCLANGGSTSTGILLNSHASLFTIGVNAFDTGYTTQVNDLGSSNTIVTGGGTSLPSQSGNSGKFLTTNGSSASWATVSGGSLPTQTGNSGKILTTDGTNLSWAVFLAVPSPVSQSGKILTSDGTNAIWDTAPSGTLPTQTGNAGKYLKTDGTNATWESGGREQLTANRTYYVRTDGSDSNNGLANTSGGAFLTIQKAIDAVATLDISIYNVVIQIGDGTYAATLTLKALTGAGTVTLRGNTTTPANVLISPTTATCVYGSGVRNWVLDSFKLAPVTSGTGINLVGQAYVKATGLNFAGTTNATFHNQIEQNSILEFTGSYTISGGCAGHWLALWGGHIKAVGITVTLSGTPAFNSAFAYATRQAKIEANGDTFSGSATGPRYISDGNSVIFTNGGGANYFPGNTTGSTASGGLYS